jgi:hypothetical protein
MKRLDVHQVSGLGSLSDGFYCERHCPICPRSQQSSTAPAVADSQPSKENK